MSSGSKSKRQTVHGIPVAGASMSPVVLSGKLRQLIDSPHAAPRSAAAAPKRQSTPPRVASPMLLPRSASTNDDECHSAHLLALDAARLAPDAPFVRKFHLASADVEPYYLACARTLLALLCGPSSPSPPLVQSAVSATLSAHANTCGAAAHALRLAAGVAEQHHSRTQPTQPSSSSSSTTTSSSTAHAPHGPVLVAPPALLGHLADLFAAAPPAAPLDAVDTSALWLSFDAISALGAAPSSDSQSPPPDPAVLALDAPAALQSLLLLAELDAVHVRNCALARECQDLERQIDAVGRLARARSLTHQQTQPLTSSAGELGKFVAAGRRASGRRDEAQGSSSPYNKLRRALSGKSRPRSSSGADSAAAAAATAAAADAAANSPAAAAAVAAVAAVASSGSGAARRTTASDAACRVTINVKVAESSAAAVLRRNSVPADTSIFVDTNGPLPPLPGAAPAASLSASGAAPAGDDNDSEAASESDPFIKAMLLIRVDNLLDASLLRDGDLTQLRFSIDPVEGVERRRRGEEMLSCPSIAPGATVTLRAFVGVLPRVADTVTLPSVLQYTRRDGSAHLLSLQISLPSSRSKLAAIVSSPAAVRHAVPEIAAAKGSPVSPRARRGTELERSPRELSPRSRARSPRARSPRARSPRARALSPRGQSPRSRARSPRARSPSPRARSPSPPRERSPRDKSPTPRGRSRSRGRSPTRGLSPARALSPAREAVAERGRSPTRPTTEVMAPLVAEAEPVASPAPPLRGRARTVLENMVRSLSPSRAKSPSPSRAKSPERAAAAAPAAVPAAAAAGRGEPVRSKSPLRQVLRALSPSRQHRHTVSGVAAAAGADEAMRRRAGTNLPIPKRMYGVPIERLGDKITPFDIPVRWLEDHAQICEGLFRQSGSSDQIEMLCSLIDTGQTPYLDASFDPYTVAGVLQRFLLELPEPLLTWHLYDDFVNAVDAPASLLRALARRVPDKQRYMLVRLIRLLGAVHDNAAMTRMPASNLAVVFAPSLLRHRDPLTAMRSMRASIALVQRLIVDRGEVLGSRAAQHPQHAYTANFNTLEAEAVERIFAAQRELNKSVTRDQQLAAFAAAEKNEARRRDTASSSNAALRPAAVSSPAAVVAALQATPAIGTPPADASAPVRPLMPPLALDAAMQAPIPPPSIAGSSRSSSSYSLQSHAAPHEATLRAALPIAAHNNAADDDFIPDMPNDPSLYEELPAPPIPSAASARAALVATYMAEMESRNSAVDADSVRLRNAEEESDVLSLQQGLLEDE